MALSFEQISETLTEDQVLEVLLKWASLLGFNTTSWQTGSVQLTTFRLFARLGSNMSSVVADYVTGGIPGKARGAMLDILGEGFYDMARTPATATEGRIALTASAAAPPHAWSSGDLLIANKAEDDDLNDPAIVYEVVEGGTINPGQTVSVAVRCRDLGARGNVPPPNTPLFLWTPLVGVTASNPPIGSTGTWITSSGQNKEDDDRYTERLVKRWNRLTYGNTMGAYESWVYEANPDVNRVKVITADENVVQVYAAKRSGNISPGEATDIQDYLDGVADGVGRRPINDVLTVSPCVPLGASFQAVVRASSSAVEGLEDKILAALYALRDSYPIGGKRMNPSASTGLILLSDLYEAVTTIPGVIDVSFIHGSNTVTPGNQVVVGAFQLWIGTFTVDMQVI